MSKFLKIQVTSLLLSSFFIFGCAKEKIDEQVPDNADMVTTAVDEDALLTQARMSYPIETQPASYKPITATVSSNCGGYWEGLPANYESTTLKYPVIIYTAGQSKLGTGSQTDLAIITGGIHGVMKRQILPPNFKVNNENLSFIVITPQYKKWPTADDINNVVNYMTTKYRIDKSRIYMSGYSMGGGICWDYASKYASKLAAMVPMCGPATFTYTKAKLIAYNNLPIWAFHNLADEKVSVSNTQNFINGINTFKPTPLAQATYPAGATLGHDVWTKACDPVSGYKLNGMNIYQWMLQYKRQF